MAEKYFPGFEFKHFKASKPVEIVFRPLGPTEPPVNPIGSISLDDLFGKEVFDLEGPDVEPWESKQIYREFTRDLDLINKLVRSPQLTMAKRSMKFVTENEMRPKTKKERQYLMKLYGEYVVDGGAGDCTRNPDGTFVIRIGFVGQEATSPKDTVIEVMAHEYGHTLGDNINDIWLEELKAYTFANLFMKRYYHVDQYRVLQLDDSKVHTDAQHMLEQLLDNKIREEEILAHLTRKKFGRFSPNDYLKR